MKCNLDIKKKKHSNYFFRDFSVWMLILPSILLMYIIVWRPMVGGTALSFCKMQGYTPVKFVGFDNYKRVLTDILFLKTLSNTFLYVFWSLIIGFLPPLVLSIMLNEIVHANDFLKVCVYLPGVIPTVAVAMIWFYIYFPNSGGFLNMFIGLFGVKPIQWLQIPAVTIPLIIVSMTWRGFGSTTITYIATLQGISKEMYEAALIDGAGFLRRVWSITLPQIYPVVALFFVRQMITVFQTMEQPLLMTGGGPNNASTSMALQSYRYAFVYGNTDNALALGVITFLILMVMTIVYFVIDKRMDTGI